MFTTGEAISAGARFFLNPGSDVWQYDTELRERLRFGLTRVCQEAFRKAPFWWKQANASVSLTAGVGSLPADFNSFGTQGQVYVTTNQAGPLQYMQPADFEALSINSPSQGTPQFYTLKDVDGSGIRKIACWPASTATLLLKRYDRRVPELIDCPIAPTVAVVETAGNLTGDYTYRVTFTTASGETEGGTISEEISPSSEQATITEIPVSPCRSVTGRKLYRNEAASPEVHKLLTTISDNLATVSFTDNVADVSLGVQVPNPSTALYTGLEIFPSDFHESLLLDGLREFLGSSVSDPREPLFSQRWLNGVREMWADQKQGRNQTQVMPVYGQSADISGGMDYWRRRIPI